VRRAARALAAVLVAGCAARGSTPPLTPAVSRLHLELDSAFAGPEFARASWGVVVQSLADGQVLYRRNAERLFMPASNMKIVTSAVALARLGPDFRWRTPVLAAGTRSGDTLHGDLIIAGRGDPTWSARVAGGDDPLPALRPWADSVRSRGIRVITGRILADEAWFPDAPLGEGWSWDDLEYSYSAPAGAVQFNEGFALVEVTPGAPGQPASVAVRPRSAPFRLAASVRTLPAESSTTARVTRTRLPFSDSLVVGGTIAAGGRPVVLAVSVRDPGAYAAAALGQVLEEAGLVVGRERREGRREEHPDGRKDTLFVWQSPPLRDVLPHFMKPSQNQIGEALLRTTGGVVTGVASADSGRAVAAATLTGFGIDPAAFVLSDGSGLSRYNYVAPEALARILEVMARRPDADVFLNSLPIGGVDGTLATRMRGTAAEGNVRAKTGSIANTRTLSGYVATRDGERLVFVLMANHFTVSSRVAERVQDHVVERLANFSRQNR
jgi:D-alanyl-D-alanine carboxypeptidase/D-alanyl-D-alanine-endopeptidase (penicillin-binding protein 4)